MLLPGLQQNNTSNDSCRVAQRAEETVASAGLSKRLTKEEEYELAYQARAGSVAARNKLVDSNYGLVAKIAHDYAGSGNSFEDLYQEGCMGLIMAANKFDPEMNCRFSTYATIWIRKYISKSSIRSGFSTQIPRRIEPYINKVLSFSKYFELNNNRKPTEQEISENTNVAIDIVRDVLRFSSPPVEYDDAFGSSAAACYDQDDENVENSVVAELLRTELKAVLRKVLTDKELFVIYSLYYNDVRVTKRDISARLHISVPQVTLTEKHAFQKIRDYFVANRIDFRDFLAD